MLKRRIKLTRLVLVFFLIMAWIFIGDLHILNFHPGIQEAQASGHSDDGSDDDDDDDGDDGSDDDGSGDDDDGNNNGGGGSTPFTPPQPPPPNFQGSIIQKPRTIR